MVWVSTNNLVFPALHLQLKRAGLLELLPTDLMEYMEEFTGTNRERNRQILKQVQEVTSILNQHAIAPIYIKGTANLLQGLYDDMAERMMGDIDLLVGEKDLFRAVEALKADGFYCPDEFHPGQVMRHRHYPPMVKDGCQAAVEIHHRLLEPPMTKHFNYSHVKDSLVPLKGPGRAFVLSKSRQVLLNLLVSVMHERRTADRTFNLRQVYDLFLLSGEVDPLDIAAGFGHYFNRMNAQLAISSKSLGGPPCLRYEPTKRLKIRLRRFMFELHHPKTARNVRKVMQLALRALHYTSLAFKTLYRADVRWLLTRKLRNPEWYRSKLHGKQVN